MGRIALFDLGPSVRHQDLRKREVEGIFCLPEHVFFEKNEVLVCEDQLIAVEHGGKLKASAVADLSDAQDHSFFGT